MAVFKYAVKFSDLTLDELSYWDRFYRYLGGEL